MTPSKIGSITVLTAIENNIIPEIYLAVRSKNAFSGQGATNATAISERGERIAITVPLVNESKKLTQ